MILHTSLAVAVLFSLASALPQFNLTPLPAPADVLNPVQIRLAYGGPTEMQVSWNTFAHLASPFVRYGRSLNRLTSISTHNAESVTYPTSLTFNNHVLIKGLRPNTKYFYQPAFGNSSQVFSFTTTRAAGDHSPFTMAVVVDLGLIGPDGLSTTVGTGASHPLLPGEMNTIQSLKQDDSWEFLWHPGDIGYADDWLTEEKGGFLPNTSFADGSKVYESILNQFYNEMTPITSQKAWMVGPGNHEANCDNGKNVASVCLVGQTNFTGFRNHFRMPSSQSGGLENFWYSFDHGMVHYVQFDTETDLGHQLVGPDEPNGSASEDSGPFGLMDQQIDWLIRDLSKVDRKKTPWVIAAGHRPWYISTGTDCPQCQTAFEGILNKFSVDLVLSGHVHFFEREAPLFNNTVDPRELDNPRFPWYITNGAGGHYNGLDDLSSTPSPFSRATIQMYGWSRLTFHNCTHMTHEFISSASGKALDTATLFKDRKCIH